MGALRAHCVDGNDNDHDATAEEKCDDDDDDDDNQSADDRHAVAAAW